MVETPQNKMIKNTLKKWSTCQRQNCRINISDSWASLAHCNMCEKYWVEGMVFKKEFHDWVREWRCEET
jgi:hypothetical protein